MSRQPIDSLINKGLFVAKGDSSFIFDLVSLLLGLFGIDTVSLLQVIGIIVVFIISYLWQKKLAVSKGINLSCVLIDDRNYYK